MNKKEDNPKIRNVVFDMGNVLMTFDWRNLCREMGFLDKTTQIVKSEFADLWKKALVDELTFEEMREIYLMRYPENADELALYLTHVHESMKPYDYTVAWIKNLKEAGYKLYVLSNWTRFNYERLLKNGSFDYLKEFDGEIWSFDARQAKPNAEIYKMLFEKYSLKPEECVYLDDLESNIRAGESFGMNGIVFKSYISALKDMKKLGMKFNEC